MAWKVSADLGRFDEAVEALRARTTLTDDEYYQLEGAGRSRAFSYAGGAELAVVQTVLDELAKAIERGQPIEEFRASIREKLGTFGPKGAHLETIFRNACQTAYNRGRWNQMKAPDVVKFRPYFLYDSILDSRTTEVCKACNGTLKLHDDPWWLTHWPPLHHRCRSSVRNLRASEAVKRGITEGDVEGATPQGTFGYAPPLEQSSHYEPKQAGHDAAAWAEYLRKRQAANDQLRREQELERPEDDRAEDAGVDDDGRPRVY